MSKCTIFIQSSPVFLEKGSHEFSVINIHTIRGQTVKRKRLPIVPQITSNLYSRTHVKIQMKANNVQKTSITIVCLQKTFPHRVTSSKIKGNLRRKVKVLTRFSNSKSAL